MKEVDYIHTSDAPSPAGHYSQAVRCRDMVYVSALPTVPASADGGADHSIEAQSRHAVLNLLTVLKAAGCTADDLLKVTVYLVGAHNWAAFNSVYAELMGSARPARTVVPIPEWYDGHMVGLDAIARLPAGSDANT